MTDLNPLARSLQLLWEGLPERAKGPKSRLTLGQIVTAGIELADTDGIEALSMRKLAQKLDVGTMSLYRYVPSKAELLDLMLDAVVGPSQARRTAAERGWREFLATTARETRKLYITHSWALQANWSRPVLGPNSVADLNLFLTGVKNLSLSDQEKMNLATVIDSYVIGTVRQELLWLNASSESGMSDDEFWTYQLPTLNRVMSSGRFPAMAELSENTFDSTWEENFEFGLELILDGLETRLGRP
ncbi:TetR/AcrR family transcriptional regulator [Rhodococcus sp. NPDC060090]|uniref:TetR/AcrR family transcriptional regulator n=1 Tax=Rhodococcus sp. NPDC060090 TaxID=3347056 RepID=UPI00365B09B1